MLSNSETVADPELMVRALRAVSDPARLRLLRLCADRPTSVSELAAATNESEPNVSRQLKQLALAGLLRRVRRGQRVEYLPSPESGFAAELVGLLLSRLDEDHAQLREARARLRALETTQATTARVAGEWFVSGRLGRSLRGVLQGSFNDDFAGARVLVRCQYREVLESLLPLPSSLTLRIDAKSESAAVRGWAEMTDRPVDLRSALELRAGERFGACLDAPPPEELRKVQDVAALFARARLLLIEGGVLVCVVPYELFEQEGSPLARLRALLAEQGFDCLALVPVEAEGQHVMLVRARLRAERSRIQNSQSLSV